MCVCHLIFHGSTKVDLSGAVGRYGSGFIGTHLLSPAVRLRGRLSEGGCFDFIIDRSGADVYALSADMENAWQAFSQSVWAEDGTPSAFTAEFEYALDREAAELVTAGLSQLEACASLVLAFSPEAAEIDVRTPDACWRMSRAGSTQLDDSISLLKIDYRHGGEPASRWVAISDRGTSAVVTLPLEEINGAVRVALTSSVPRLYVLFPMVTTERLALPAAISSLRFKPREDRDGITLQGEAEGPAESRHILEQASADMAALLRCAATCGWQGLEPLILFDTSGLRLRWISHATDVGSYSASATAFSPPGRNTNPYSERRPPLEPKSDRSQSRSSKDSIVS